MGTTHLHCPVCKAGRPSLATLGELQVQIHVQTVQGGREAQVETEQC